MDSRKLELVTDFYEFTMSNRLLCKKYAKTNCIF